MEAYFNPMDESFLHYAVTSYIISAYLQVFLLSSKTWSWIQIPNQIEHKILIHPTCIPGLRIASPGTAMEKIRKRQIYYPVMKTHRILW